MSVNPFVLGTAIEGWGALERKVRHPVEVLEGTGAGHEVELARVRVAPTEADNGDFERFYAAQEPSARRYARTVLGLGRSEELEDVLQDAWARAWRSWHVPEPDRREAWFLRIVRNACLDRHRARTTTPLLDAHLPTEAGADEAAVGHVDSDRTLALLQQLSPPLREAVWLREVSELSYAEIAEVQGVPIGTVMSRLHAGRAKLAKIIRREDRKR